MAIALAQPLVAEAGEDLEITADPSTSTQPPDFYDLTIMSKADAPLTIANVSVNRGNCRVWMTNRQLPQVLHFGESLRWHTAVCHPIEVVVEANGQSETYDLGPPTEGQAMRVAADVHGGTSNYYNTLTVTSYVDLTLSRITINRGSCGPLGDVKLDPPREMHFGDYVTVRSFPCQPIEVTAVTDKGPITMQME